MKKNVFEKQKGKSSGTGHAEEQGFQSEGSLVHRLFRSDALKGQRTSKLMALMPKALKRRKAFPKPTTNEAHSPSRGERLKSSHTQAPDLSKAPPPPKKVVIYLPRNIPIVKGSLCQMVLRPKGYRATRISSDGLSDAPLTHSLERDFPSPEAPKPWNLEL